MARTKTVTAEMERNKYKRFHRDLSSVGCKERTSRNLELTI